MNRLCVSTHLSRVKWKYLSEFQSHSVRVGSKMKLMTNFLWRNFILLTKTRIRKRHSFSIDKDRGMATATAPWSFSHRSYFRTASTTTNNRHKIEQLNVNIFCWRKNREKCVIYFSRSRFQRVFELIRIQEKIPDLDRHQFI